MMSAATDEAPLSRSTLVLNASYEPLHVVHWQRAIKMLILDKVEALAHYDRALALGESAALMLPAVVRLHRRVQPHRIRVRFSRANVFARDQHTCQYCGVRFASGQLTYDHVIPRTSGGKTHWGNIVACCIPCNRLKGGRTPEQAGMCLLKPPVRPEWLPSIGRVLLASNPPEAWRPFLWEAQVVR